MAKGGFFESLKKVYDDFEVESASESIGKVVEVISTGSPTLDDKLFCGGIPFGRVCQFYGPAGSGKTLMAMLVVKEAQKKNKTSKQLWIDAEGTFSAEWAKSLGINTKRVQIIEPPHASDGQVLFEILLGKPKVDAKKHYAGKSQAGFFDAVASKEEDYNLVVLDSLGQVISPIEQTSDVGKQNFSPLSRFLAVEFKKITVDLKKANIPFIVINHVSTNMDPYAANQYTFSGGNKLNHSLSMNIFFIAVGRKDSQILNAKEEKIGQTLRAKIEKNKFGPWPRQAEFMVDFSKGIVNLEEEIAELAIDYGFVERPNNTSYVYGETKWVGREKFLTALRENPALVQELHTKTIEARNSKLEKLKLELKEDDIEEVETVNKNE